MSRHKQENLLSLCGIKATPGPPQDRGDLIVFEFHKQYKVFAGGIKGKRSFSGSPRYASSPSLLNLSFRTFRI